ncbi:uncharacterized protein Dyak_GE28186 [Drosophila yakuba]|uniref:Uncharacterized protein n=1 Tax=Drosophila yakuba TaxID=7245 RepID=A0A0R1EBJ0_DROYA|nr:uncharacterized protein Dyak_GE28186 [Drosophila yakuba]
MTVGILGHINGPVTKLNLSTSTSTSASVLLPTTYYLLPLTIPSSSTSWPPKTTDITTHTSCDRHTAPQHSPHFQ